jgi:NADH-quinone oxidoreductase subunit L
MAIATAAITGIPPFAGFWSKDEILASAFERGGWFSVLWIVGLVTAVITGFYMMRLFMLVFFGKSQWDENVDPHESPRVMTVPLILLAALVTFGGLINTPLRLTLESFLEPSFELISLQHPPENVWTLVVVALLSVLAGVVGVYAAWVLYRRPAEEWKRFEDRLQPIWGLWEDAYRVDDLYGRTLVAPGKKAATAAAFGFDVPVIDGAVNGVARVVRGIGAWARPLQTGYVRNYGALLLGGAVVVVIWLVAGGV